MVGDITQEFQRTAQQLNNKDTSGNEREQVVTTRPVDRVAGGGATRRVKVICIQREEGEGIGHKAYMA